MEFREFSAESVSDAITKACVELEVSSDRLEYTIVQEASSGFLGFGRKPAIIRVRKKEEEAISEPVIENIEHVKEEHSEPEQTNIRKEVPKRENRENFKRENHRKKENHRLSEKDSREEKSQNDVIKEKTLQQEEPKRERSEEEIETLKKSAREFLNGVFQAMELPVNIEITYNTENDNLDIDFSGEDMGILIGKRGQTLDSLQYLTSLVVNKEQGDYIRVKLDTENYRKRRKETLENLARNIAFKVRKTRKPVSLEPMNPYERRIIHSALQGNRYVETYSEGNEPYRHVVVTLKRSSKAPRE